jgi:hypothetical protein
MTLLKLLNIKIAEIIHQNIYRIYSRPQEIGPKRRVQIKNQFLNNYKNWSKSGLVLDKLPEPIRCNLRLKSEFYESLETIRYA